MRELPPTLEDILAASRAVARLARTQRDAVAVAWTIRNRARAATTRAAGERRRGGVFGDGSVSAAARSLLRDAGASADAPGRRALLRAASTVCAVWSETAPDPTCGATVFCGGARIGGHEGGVSLDHEL